MSATADSSSLKEILLFDGTDHNQNVVVYAPDWDTDPYQFVKEHGRYVLSLKHKPSGKGQRGGMQVNVSHLLKAYGTKLPTFKDIAIRLKGLKPSAAKLILVDEDANAASASIVVGTSRNELQLSLKTLKPDHFMLLPRPYPGFQARYFDNKSRSGFDIRKLDKVQILLEGDDLENEVQIESIKLINKVL